MKSKILLGILILVLAVPLYAATPVGQKTPAGRAAQIIDTREWLDANKILMFVANQGNFAYDAGQFFGKNDGLYYPFTGIESIQTGRNDKTAVFDAGLWMGAKDRATGSNVMAVAVYSTEYTPGVMRDSTFTPDQPAYRVYKLYSDSLWNNPNQVYLDYVANAVPMGAPEPFRLDTLRDSTGGITGIDTVSQILGDQFCWSVFNDADPEGHTDDAGSTLPMGIEVQQSAFAFRSTGSLGNCTFLKFKLLNKGPKDLDSMYVSIWSDPDVGESGNDLVGCDTLFLMSIDKKTGKPQYVSNLGYAYSSGNDNVYGPNSPAVGFDFFQGPLDSTGNPADTAIMWGKYWPGNRNLPMSSFNKYINGTDPNSYTQTYNYMKGLNADGTPYSYNGRITKYFNSGDPVKNVGDVDVSPADRRLMLTTGPFVFNQGDSTEIVCAVVVGQGSSAISSITVLRNLDLSAQKSYDKFFAPTPAPAPPQVTVTQLNDQVVLRWTDLSERNPGAYPFEGYTVLQATSPTGPWDTLAFYDIPDGLTTVTDFFFDPNAGIDVERTVKVGNDLGIRRYYNVNRDAISAGPLHNYSTYYFKVEAYSVDTTAVNGEKTLTSETIVPVTPQPTRPGTTLPTAYGDTLAVTHIGNSDGSVAPFVVDPTKVTNDTYRVTFDTLPDTTITAYEYALDTTFAGWDSIMTPCFVDTVAHDTTFCVDSVHIVDFVDTTLPHVDTVIATVPFWTLFDVTADSVVLTRQRNQAGSDSIAFVDGLLVKVSGPPPGLKTVSPSDNTSCDPADKTLGWCIPNGTRRFTWANASDFLFEDFSGALGWIAPVVYFNGLPEPVPAASLSNVLLKLAATDTLGNPVPGDPNISYGYRYLRGATAPPAQPQFAPFIIHADPGYSFQDFNPSIPLSAWNTETDPPTRLALGYLENNSTDGLLDGKYWPPFTGGPNNTGGSGPREWLFIFNAPYSETPNAAWETDVLNDGAIPIMYWATWARRAEVAWAAGDEFQMYANHINTPADTFTFSGAKPELVKSQAALNNIRTVPNPYYLRSRYDNDVFRRQIRFTNLPDVCTITIYNLAGDQVAVIHKTATDRTWEGWDVQNSNGVPVASGIYIYVVDAPGYGQKVGKMAVFVEQEQLKNY